MSNQSVGTVYQSIIEEVINSSRIDFEEAGINVSTLDDLKQVWQGKLSDLKIAQFPWDPPPPETQAPTAATQARTQQHQPQQSQQQTQIKPDPNGVQYQNGGIKIKTEPGTESQGVYSAPTPGNLTGNPTHDPQLAAMRAQQNIAQKFGPHIQSRPVAGGGGLVLPGMGPGSQSQQELPRTTNVQHNGIPQHDGGNETDQDGIPVEGYGLLTRQEADNVFITRIRQAEQKRTKAAEEISEALRTLKISSKARAKGKRKARRRRIDAYDEALDSNSTYPYPSTILSVKSGDSVSASCLPQLDGDSDDDVPDEDAINSDLDDPEDDEIDNDDEDEVPQIMLCMYDKVQRTKNKWKCVLKDGVLTINGQEYVFHKANGEYEW